MSDQPKVTVIMPVWNARQYLAVAIESILRQTFTDFEFLIFDDGSTDGSTDILKTYANRDERIKLTLGSHLGLTRLLQRGVELAKGQYIARMDADDISLPDRFARQVEFMDLHAEFVVIGGQTLRIDPDGDDIGPLKVPELHEEIDGRHMRGIGNQIVHPTSMMRTEAVRRVGNYRSEFEPAEDFDLFLRLAEMGFLANLSDVTLKFRMHLKSVTHSRIKQQHERTCAAAAEAHHRRGLVQDRQQADENRPAPTEVDIAWSWVRTAYKSGNIGTARKYARRLILRDPFRTRSWWLFMGSMLGPVAQPLHRLFKGDRAQANNGG
jgi:glycosyltransferase involved in cell wall biosynthesis